MHKVNGELFSCGITDSGRVPSREGDIQNLVLLNGLSKFAQNFTVGFLKLLSILTQSTLLFGETSHLRDLRDRRFLIVHYVETRGRGG